MTPTFIRTRNWAYYPVNGMIVDGRDVDQSAVNALPRHIDVGYDPVHHRLTPSAFIPNWGKPFVVVSYTRMLRGYNHSSNARRFKTLEAALKAAAELAVSQVAA